MAGIYIHIPFCKSRCQYCDFFSTTLFEQAWPEYEECLRKEAMLRSESFARLLEERGDVIRTVYFGGGTPSLICEDSVVKIISAIRSAFDEKLWQVEEITMEANPGDLTPKKLEGLRAAGVNRLSIGIQSMNDTLLRRIGRRHNAQQAIEAVRMAQEAGFGNISIDLMYGLPGETEEMWMQDVEKACGLGIQHVSAYCLTYEEGTPLYRALESGEVEELDDETLNRMQEKAEERLLKSGIKRYEISNYAVDNYESKHNGSYWTKAPYMGLGAGAHSYDGKRHRSWNPDDLQRYIAKVKAAQTEAELPLEGEMLTEDDAYNETVMLGLRTVKGVDTKDIAHAYLEHFLKHAEEYIRDGLLLKDGDFVRASAQGMRLSNRIIEDLMV